MRKHEALESIRALGEDPKYVVFFYFSSAVILGCLGAFLDHLHVPIRAIVSVIASLVLPLHFFNFALYRWLSEIEVPQLDVAFVRRTVWILVALFLACLLVSKLGERERN